MASIPIHPTQDGGSPRWNRPDVPHKGWYCVNVEDRESPSFTCEMCGFNGVRYVHTLCHPEYHDDVCVGCVCAGHLEEDYQAPKKRERELKNAARRRTEARERHSRRRQTWLDPEKWRVSKNNSIWRNCGANHIVIFGRAGNPDYWKFILNGEVDAARYSSSKVAAMAAFDRLYPTQPKGS